MRPAVLAFSLQRDMRDPEAPLEHPLCQGAHFVSIASIFEHEMSGK